MVPTSLVTWAGGQVTRGCWGAGPRAPGLLVTSGSVTIPSEMKPRDVTVT